MSQPNATPAPERDWGEMLLDLAAIVLGILVIWQTSQIRVTAAYAAVGPRAVPLLVGIGLILVGGTLLLLNLTGRATTTGEGGEDVDPTLPTDWRAVGLLAVSLVLYVVLMNPAGFIPASIVLFFGAAYAMNSKQYLRDFVIAVLLAVVLYIAFTRGLGIRLPAGPLAGII